MPNNLDESLRAYEATLAEALKHLMEGDTRQASNTLEGALNVVSNALRANQKSVSGENVP